MDNKCRKVLQMILFDYIKTFQPVSSKNISLKCGYAPSSIRNWMSNLEKNGYLKNIHTSSGRIPTDKAWRFYIDGVFELQKQIVSEKEILKKNYNLETKKRNKILSNLSKIFYYVLKNSDYDIFPKPEKAIFKEIILNLKNKKTISGVIVTSNGFTKNFQFELKESISQTFLEELNELLNKLLSGVTLSNLRMEMTSRIESCDYLSQEKKIFLKQYFENAFNFSENSESEDTNTASNIDTFLKEIEEFSSKDTGAKNDGK
ncbi:MAG: hypothetical protein A2539_09835 [Elusimicrobia bacterium RIFOXYD2_FULL_34_15]|nr:MAG: hypothetical protein A2539_09835 [Elusimicrobia bacterium RIFOXYD2_FULL_34_15]